MVRRGKGRGAEMTTGRVCRAPEGANVGAMSTRGRNATSAHCLRTTSPGGPRRTQLFRSKWRSPATAGTCSSTGTLRRRLKNSFSGPKKCGAGSFLPSTVSMVMVPAKARDLAAARPPSHSLLFTICSTFAPGREPRPPPPHPGGGFCGHTVARVRGSAGSCSFRPSIPAPSPLLPGDQGPFQTQAKL